MYDYGQRIQIEGLDLPEMYEVHFMWNTLERAKTVIEQHVLENQQ